MFQQFDQKFSVTRKKSETIINHKCEACPSGEVPPISAGMALM